MAKNIAHEPTRLAVDGTEREPGSDTTDPSSSGAVERGAAEASAGRAVERDMAQVLAAVETGLFGGLSQPLHIGRFQVERLLGRGGMGVVYAAHDPDLDRTIAIKLIRSELSSAGESAKHRLLREAQAMARLNHPNVIHVYDLGELDGDVFVAMELVVGDSLGDWIAAEPRDLEALLFVLSQAGRGLAAAHAAGIVHRDFKPDNVLVGDDGRVRVLDFGLAAPVSSGTPLEGGAPEAPRPERAPTRPHTILDDDGSLSQPPSSRGPSGSFEAVQLTRTGALMGTPTYMAPEQFQGERADARSDQFAFGVTLYRALYDQRPFRGRNLAALRWAVCEGQLEAPPEGRALPEGLPALIERCLSVDPSARYPDMDAVLDELARYLPGTRREAVRRRRLPRIATTFLAASLLVFAGVQLWSKSASRPLLQIPELSQACTDTAPMLDARWTPALRQRLVERFDGASAQADWQTIEARIQGFTQAWARARVPLCQLPLGEDSPALAPELQPAAATCLENQAAELGAVVEVLLEVPQERLGPAGDSLTRGLSKPADCSDERTLRAAPEPPKDADTAERVHSLRLELTWAAARERGGQVDDAERIGIETQRAAARLGYKPLLAEAHLFLGDLYTRLGRTQEAKQALMKASRAAEACNHDTVRFEITALEARLIGFDLVESTERLENKLAGLSEALPSARRPMAVAQVNLALNDIVHGQLAEARDKAVSGLVVLRGEGADTAHAEAVTTLALTLLGRYGQAHATLDPTLERIDDLHPDAVFVFGIGGILNMFQGRDREALALFERALRIERELGEHQDAHRGTAHAYMAPSLDRLGRLDEALVHYEEGLRLLRSTWGVDHPIMARVHLQLGNTYLRAGRWDEARQALEESQRIWSGSHAPQSRALSQPATGLAIVAMNKGEHAEALALLEDALPKLEEVSGHPWEAARTKFHTAQALELTRGDRARARRLATQALALLDGGDGEILGPGFDPLRAEVQAWLDAQGD